TWCDTIHVDVEVSHFPRKGSRKTLHAGLRCHINRFALQSYSDTHAGEIDDRAALVPEDQGRKQLAAVDCSEQVYHYDFLGNTWRRCHRKIHRSDTRGVDQTGHPLAAMFQRLGDLLDILV